MELQTAEYIIKQRNEPSVIAKKAALILMYTVIFAALALLSFLFAPTGFLLPFILLSAAFTAILVFATWRFVCLEYEISAGRYEITFTVIYGKTLRKRLVSAELDSLSEIGDYDASFDRIQRISLQRSYSCVSSMSAPKIWYAIFDCGEDKCIVCFEANDSLLNILRKRAPSAFRAGNSAT